MVHTDSRTYISIHKVCKHMQLELKLQSREDNFSSLVYFAVAEFEFTNATQVEVMEGNSLHICITPRANLTELLSEDLVLSLQFQVTGNLASKDY